ncbi:unnamed protein product [Darwinula stevensoni]|uniref:THAP-type domain-containing protein n=1 Tax=Darwinula stevensoni TaxID=69355 RepID=A0A7R9FP01_9CRUS|nr:unnamed protein product [Darwinula stevensoni]CAG0897395.1 unnamed protein product [Darwinula stevensoni]
MPASCCAYGCKGRAAKDGLDHTVTFHHIPKDPIRQKKWVLAMRWINFKPGKFSFICSRHFEEHCFDRTGQTVRLRDYAIPSIFNFPPHLQKNDLRLWDKNFKEEENSIFMHKKKRTTRTSQAATLQNVPVNDTAVAPGATSLIQQEGKKSPKDHTYHVSEEAKDLKRRLDDLTEALVAAKKRIVLLSGKAARLSRSNAYLKNLIKDLRKEERPSNGEKII